MDAPSINDRLIRGFLERQVQRLLGEGRASGEVLDIGCGAMPYRALLEGVAEHHVGLDLHPRDGRRPTVVGDALRLPFRSGTWDLVVATEVLEHVPDPETFVREVRRMLKVGGALVLSWPFVHPLHEAPYDYGRYSEFRIERWARTNGFALEVFERRGNLLLTTWAIWSGVARGLLASLRRRLGTGFGSVCDGATWALGWLDRAAIATAGLFKARVSSPGEGLRGWRGVLEGMPLGYCAVLRKIDE